MKVSSFIRIDIDNKDFESDIDYVKDLYVTVTRHPKLLLCS